MKTYAVKEIFGPTIQGEGHEAGESVFFLRFAGCNKWTGREEDRAISACPFCDTDFIGGLKLSLTEILGELDKLLNTSRAINKSLVISGGEPTLQLDYDIMVALKNKGWRVTLETNGSKEVQGSILDLVDHVCCSPKQGPENTKIGRIDSLKILHPSLTPERNILRFLDWNFLTEKQVEYTYIQPVMDKNYHQNLEECMAICHTHGVTLSLQLHKIIDVK